MYAPICATVAPCEAESDPSTRTRRKWAFPWFSPANGRNRLTNRDDRDLVCVCVSVRWVHDGWGWFISDGRIIMMTAIIARHPSLFRRGEAMSFPRWQPVRVVRRASEGFVCGVKLSAYRGPAPGQLRWNDLAAWKRAPKAWWWTVLSTGKQENGKYFLRLSCRFAGLLLLAGAFLFGCNLAVMGKGNQFYYTAKQRRCKFQARG